MVGEQVFNMSVLAAVLLAGLGLSQELPNQPGQPKPIIEPPRRVPGDLQSPLPGPGQPPGSGQAERLVRVRSVADVETIRPGQKFHLAFIFDLEPQWHIYWANSGASGGPTTIEVSGPPSFAIGRVLYPRPLTLKGEEGVTYGYEKQTVIFVEVTAPPDLPRNSAAFNAKLNWMVCKDVCLLGRTTQMVTVWTAPMSAPTSDPGLGAKDPLVAEFKKRLPRPLKDLRGAETRFDGTMLTIKVPHGGRSAAELFPMEAPGVSFGEPTVQVDGPMLELRVPVTVNPNDAMGRSPKIAGVIGLGNSPTEPCYEFEVSPAAP
jgi:DsbC/DsbD-like thiol-disulfide interchange protein